MLHPNVMMKDRTEDEVEDGIEKKMNGGWRGDNMIVHAKHCPTQITFCAATKPRNAEYTLSH